MKLIIDIPTDHYNEIVFQDVDKLRECVKKGTVVENVTCVDCVNRLDVLAILLNAYNESRFDGYSDYCAVSDLVTDLPALEPQQRWIPVSERLPEENEIVIASAKYGVYPEARYTKEGVWEWAYESGADYWKELDNVEAWMPLPEPYKEGDNGE